MSLVWTNGLVAVSMEESIDIVGFVFFMGFVHNKKNIE